MDTCIGYQRRQNGNMRAEPGQPRSTVMETVNLSWAITRDTSETPGKRHILSVVRKPIRGVFTTCTEMCGSGARTGMMTIRAAR